MKDERGKIKRNKQEEQELQKQERKSDEET